MATQNPFQNPNSMLHMMHGFNSMQMQAGLLPGGIPMASAPPLQAPQAPHPSDFSSSLRVQFQQQQQLSQLVTPPPMLGGVTPVRRPHAIENAMMFPSPNLPGAQFGSGRGMARQVAAQSTNQGMAMAHAGVGVGARGIADVGAFAMGGMTGLGMAEHSGLSQNIQQFSSGMMNPLVEQRQRALMLQNQSMRFVRGGSDLSAAGTGLSANASMQLSQGLGRMADSKNFQSQTGGMFNRQDVMKITKLSGDLGMLDQAQTADQIKESVGKISRALSNFMRIAEEPDLQEALRMMGQMKSLGMNLPESSMAARNARQFARMAGTDIRGVMAGGMTGANTFQQMGLSGASGFNTGMASQGMSAQLAALMNPRLLSLAGGQSGIANTLMNGAAQSGTMDALLPSMLTRRNGRLAIDQNAMLDMASGRTNIQEAMRQGATNIRQLGGREALMELSTRRRELQDEAQGAMGGQMSALMPLIHARMVTQSTPGMTMGGALRTIGMGEQQARTYEQMVSDPRFFENIRRQNNVRLNEERRELEDRRENTRSEAMTPEAMRRARRFGGGLMRRGTNALDTFMQEEFGESQDIEEEGALSGGRLIRHARGSRMSTDIQRAHLRDQLRTSEGSRSAGQAAAQLSREADVGIRDENGRTQFADRLRAPGLMGPVGGGLVNHFLGPNGFQLTEGGRGGEFMRETVMRNEGLLTRGAHLTGIPALMGNNRTSGAVEQRAQEMQRMGRMFEAAATHTQEQRTNTFEGARRAARGTGSIQSDESYARVMSVASSAINQYLDSKSLLGFQTGDVSEQGMRSEVVQRLRAEGINEADIQTMVANTDFMQEAANAGAGSRTADQQSMADRVVNAGGETSANSSGRRAQFTRQAADRARTRALGGVGVGTGLFSKANDEDRRRVLNMLGGGSDDRSKLRRRLFAAEALRRSGAAGNEQAAQQAVEMDELLRTQFGADAIAEVNAEVIGQFENLDEGVIDDIASSFDGRSATNIGARVDAVGADAARAEADTLEQGLQSALGEAGRRAFGEGGEAGMRNVRAFLEGDGELGNLSDEQKRRIRSGDMTAEELQRVVSRRAEGGSETTFSGGLTQMAKQAAQGNFNGMLDSLQEFATQGGQAPGAEATGPMSFETAVTTFSEASSRMLEAAELMSGSNSVLGIGTILSNGSPLGPGLIPTPGPFGVLGQIGNLFGGGR